MNNALFVSINPVATKKIETKLKTYEFRNYIPKKLFTKLYVYVTSPVSELKYVLEISDIISIPNKLEIIGDGNREFNEGKKAKYAYKIDKVYRLNTPIELKTLKEKFHFTPPQSYAYNDRYVSLAKYIEESQKELLWKR